MKLKDIFEIAYSVHLAGSTNPSTLARVFFMRTGISLDPATVLDLYSHILSIVNSMGYSDPLDYIKDFFPDEDLRRLAVFRKNLDVKMRLEATPVQEEVLVEEPKRPKVHIPVPETESRPLKVNRENIKSPSVVVDIPPKEKSKVMKYKKISRRFKEMDPREKEIDNRYDCFVGRMRVEGPSTDNRELIETNPFLGSMYSDIDLEFRNLMYRIYKHGRTSTKDKSKLQEEMEFLDGYFSKKLQIGRGDEESIKRLSNGIAYFMKKLQNKIFESEEREVIEMMLYFKGRLNIFYNYYRK